MLNELQDASAHSYVSPYYLAMVSMGLHRLDEAFEYLEKAYQERSGYMIWLRHIPLFAPPRQDSRYQKLLMRIGSREGDGPGVRTRAVK